MHIAAELQRKFMDFIDGYDFTKKPEDMTLEHIGDFAYLWLIHGRSAILCGHDFNTFLMTIILMADYTYAVPEYLPGVVGWSEHDLKYNLEPGSIACVGCYYCECAFDPQFFAVMAHNTSFFNRPK